MTSSPAKQTRMNWLRSFKKKKKKLNEISKETLKSYMGKRAQNWVDKDKFAKYHSAKSHIERMKGPDHHALADVHKQIADRNRSQANKHMNNILKAASKLDKAPNRTKMQKFKQKVKDYLTVSPEHDDAWGKKSWKDTARKALRIRD